ncbi:olfactory receptor 5AR1-like [Melanerpes formicivorus]|uniref:olfactory receptor 5AR1-like n=1 Tax=Melanerpes formicivorus TaxID=211600 RepID=UPI00358F723F
MAGGNHSAVTEFVLLGFTDLQELLFVVFLLLYLTTLLGNLGMIVLIKAHSQLHVPMYFFLSHFSFLEVCYSSSVAPKLLSGLLAERNVISFRGCITQFCFFAVFGTTEAFLLAVMAFDRFLAIQQPLHYSSAMSHRLLGRLLLASYAAGSLNALAHTGGLLSLSFCGPNVLNHFYCELPPLLLLSCSDTWLNEVVMATAIGFVVTASLLAITVSYACILLTVCSVPSTQGRHRALSTCTSHLLAVGLFYGPAAFLYFHPLSRQVEHQRTAASVVYTLVTPMLNPFIYSLRNKEVRSLLRRDANRLLSYIYSHRSSSSQTKAGNTCHSRRKEADT